LTGAIVQRVTDSSHIGYMGFLIVHEALLMFSHKTYVESFGTAIAVIFSWELSQSRHGFTV